MPTVDHGRSGMIEVRMWPRGSPGAEPVPPQVVAAAAALALLTSIPNYTTTAAAVVYSAAVITAPPSAWREMRAAATMRIRRPRGPSLPGSDHTLLPLPTPLVVVALPAG
jgi:hypothetical protein